MKLLFIQGGSRVRVCSNGTYYVDGNFNNMVWKRYKHYADELIVILRKIDKTFKEKNIEDNFYIKVDENQMTSRKKVFAAGDLIGVKSTVAWAARSGRDAAEKIVEFLKD